MRRYIALLGLSFSLLVTSTGCSAELIDTLLSEDSVNESKASTQASPIGGGLASPAANNNGLTTPGEYVEEEFIGDGFDPSEEENYYEEPGNGFDRDVDPGPGTDPGDGFDPALEGGTTNNNGSNNYFNEFVGYGNYFGPTGGAASLNSGLYGNDAAGSRFGGPNNAVGVLVTIAPDNHAYVSVANLSNKNTFGVRRENGDAFGVAADVLNGKRFASLFVTSIPSLTQFTFEHRTSPNPPKCSYYTATFTGSVSDGYYVAKLAGSGGCTY